MKNLFFSLLVLPLHLFAQKADSLASESSNVTNDKLSTWYKSTYKVASTQPSVVTHSEAMPVHKRVIAYKSPADMFLFSPYLYSNRPFSTTAKLTNPPYYDSYLNPTGASTFGQVLLAGGINYLVDKAIAGKEKKSEKK
jgi:hypothetical protein